MARNDPFLATNSPFLGGFGARESALRLFKSLMRKHLRLGFARPRHSAPPPLHYAALSGRNAIFSCDAALHLPLQQPLLAPGTEMGEEPK